MAPGEGPALSGPATAQPLHNPYDSLAGTPRRDDACKISAEVPCGEDRPVSANLNKWPRLLWKPQGWKSSTLTTKRSEADFISALKRFMTRKGKVGVQCFLAKSIAAALEEALRIRSTHPTSAIPNSRTVSCTWPALRYKNSGFLTLSRQPVSFYMTTVATNYYICNYTKPISLGYWKIYS